MVALLACSPRPSGFRPPEPSDASRVFEDRAAAAGLAFAHQPVDDGLSLADRVAGGVCVLSVDGGPPRDLFFAQRRGPASASKLFIATHVFDYRD